MPVTTQPPVAAIRADLAAAPNVVALKNSTICGLGVLCKHAAATVRYGEAGSGAGDFWADGECGEILAAIVEGINARTFVRESATTWTRLADDGWSLSLDGRQLAPPHRQTITMDGDRPVAITLRAEGGELFNHRVRSVTWRVEYVRASVASRTLDLPARSIFIVSYVNDQRVVVKSRFRNYRAFKTSSRFIFDQGYTE